MPRLTSIEQYAFLKGRDISDNTIQMQEMIRLVHKNPNHQNVIIKLDMQKAFDMVSWSFLNSVLLQFGFHGHIVKIILQNISSACFSVLINGVATGLFKSSRDIKQGDPISPFLYNLITETFSRGIKSLIASDYLTGFKMPRGVAQLSHLMYADDTAVFLSASKINLLRFLKVLKAYEMSSGQRVNYSKSEFYMHHKTDSRVIRKVKRTTV